MNKEYDDVGSGRRRNFAKKKKNKTVDVSEKRGGVFSEFIPSEIPSFISETFKWISDEGRFDHTNLNADIRAKARGCKVVMPEPDELFVDIDREEDLAVFKRNVKWLQKEKLVISYKISKSPSGKSGHYHIVVKLSRAVRDAYERIGLQAILGSDRLREVLSWRNAMHNSGRPTCFFENQDNKVKKILGKLEMKIKDSVTAFVDRFVK